VLFRSSHTYAVQHILGAHVHGVLLRPGLTTVCFLIFKPLSFTWRLVSSDLFSHRVTVHTSARIFIKTIACSHRPNFMVGGWKGGKSSLPILLCHKNNFMLCLLNWRGANKIFGTDWGRGKGFKYFKAWFNPIFPFFYRIWLFNKLKFLTPVGPPLWSSGQGSWLQIQRSRVRFPALPDFLIGGGRPLSLVSLVRSIEELLE
jgi:hypothetical protein